MRLTGLHSESKLLVSQSLVSEVCYQLTPDIKKDGIGTVLKTNSATVAETATRKRRVTVFGDYSHQCGRGLIAPPTRHDFTTFNSTLYANQTQHVQGKKFSSLVWHSAVHILLFTVKACPRIPCFIMTNEVIIRCQKMPEVGIRCIPVYTPQYTPVCSTVDRVSVLKMYHRNY